MTHHPVLDQFHPLIAQWFKARFDSPTDIQIQAWPRIAQGEHLLITAPTGSGKTLTAFLWAINQFLQGKLETGASRVLYISPLKALNNDIERNLRQPLAELEALARNAGIDFPSIRIQTRSGDSDAGDRRRLLRHPPEILITTPESLNLMLSSRGGQTVLCNFETVILDEIHSVMDSKRGAYLMTAIERLVDLGNKDFQRIALSATINPLPLIAAYVAGYQRLANNRFEARNMGILCSEAAKRYDVKICYPKQAADRPMGDKVWDSLVPEWVDKIRQNQATLLFVNSRALCEKLTLKINIAAKETLAYAHHGSLSKEIRGDVERKLKAGELKAIVATSTLEMGIDIGHLDEVILVQCPPGIASTIQRIGRAGHGVDQVSRCTIYPTHPMEFIESAVLAKAINDRDIEPIKTIENPLDVLAQIIISMSGVASWDLDEMYLELRRSKTFHKLSQGQFDLVIDMLAGRFEENHLHMLRPKVSIDRDKNSISAKKSATLSLYLSGGVIPDRGYFQLRHANNNARIGELDEEFVWEAKVGSTFSLGTQHWQIKKITHSDVMVLPAKPTGIAPPFWKSEQMSRPFHYALRINEFLAEAEQRLANNTQEAGGSDDLSDSLLENYRDEIMRNFQFDETLALELIKLLSAQRMASRAPLPHRYNLVFEITQASPGGAKAQQLILHTGWGAEVNRPLAMAIEAAWENKWGEQPEVFVTDQCLLLQLSHRMGFSDLMALIDQDDIEVLLRKRLEGSGFFGARFRENAGRALLLSKGRFNERKPLWMSRLQSQKLLDSVLQFEDFPILLETWRGCLQDEFDLPNLKLMLDEIRSGIIKVSEINTATPTPFARTLAWQQINTYMYMDDQPKSNKSSKLNQDLIQEIIKGSSEKPRIPLAINELFIQKRQRLLPDYLPLTSEDLIEWVIERSFIPWHEWSELLADTGLDWQTLTDRLVKHDIGSTSLVIAKQDLDIILPQLTNSEKPYLANWLQYYGPITTANIAKKTGIETDVLTPLLTSLKDQGRLFYGRLIVDDDTNYWCDINNYEILLRFVRQSARVDFEAKSAACLTPFLYNWQNRLASDPLLNALENLRLYPAKPGLWESELLPARVADYQSSMLDLSCQENNILWLGDDKQRLCFSHFDDLDLLAVDTTPSALFDDNLGRYEYGNLLDKTGLSSEQLTTKLWETVWQGQVTNDSLKTLRQGIETGFKSEPLNAQSIRTSARRIRRSGFAKFVAKTPFSGAWYQIAHPTPSDDLLDREELNKDRVRLLLERYGILCRELLLREGDKFQWRNIFRSLRLMELSGEVLSGYFFEDIPGLQFISSEALGQLRSEPTETIFWLNAADPLSCCGLQLSTLKQQLPKRLSTSHLVYHGERLVLVSEKNAKQLRFNIDADSPDIDKYLAVFDHLLNRSFQPLKRLNIESINQIPAKASPYLDVLKRHFDVMVDHKSVYLQTQPR